MQSNRQLLNDKLWNHLLKKLKNHIEQYEYKEFNQLIIDNLKIWCVQGKFEQAQNLLHQIGLLFE